MKRMLLLGLLAGLLTTGAGCGLFHAIFYSPCETRCGCGVCGGVGCDTCDSCDEGCGPAQACGRPVRGHVYASRRAVVADCDEGCDSCGDSCVDPCADPCGCGCYGRCWHRGPLSCVFALFTRGCWWGPNCGERYWGDFYSDPPDYWDPCDGSGNYTGGGCSSCGGNARGGCSSCGGGHVRSHAGGRYTSGAMMEEEQEGDVVSETERTATPAPKPVAEPHKAPPKSSRRQSMNYSM